jgi:hypothetical protein
VVSITAGRLAVAAAVVALVAPVAAITGAAPACAAGEIRVSVVVDFGDLPNPPPTTSTCVSASDGDNGAEILAARARQIGTPAPRFDSSGLLCAIDGLPSTGCGVRTQSGYRYWSYWHGSAAGWEYSSVGPTGSRVKAARSEGWHFVDGTGRPNDPAPRGAADPAAVCRAAPTPGSTSPPATAAPGSSPPTPAVGATRPPASTAGIATTTAAGVTSTSAAAPPADAATTSTTALDTRTDAVASARRASKEGSGGGGRAAGTAAGVVAVLALIGGGVLTARRRKQA